MRIQMVFLMILALGLFAPVQAQSTPDATSYANLEPITIENAARLVQLPGELTDVNDGFDVSPDGKRVAVARPDGVYIYDMGSFEAPVKVFQIDGADRIYAPTFSPNGSQINVTFFGESIKAGSVTRLWDLESGTLIRDFETTAWPLNGGALFSPNGEFIAGTDTLFYSCSGGCDPGSRLFVWNIDGQLFCSPNLCYARYGSGGLTFTPDSKTLLWSKFEYASDLRGGEYYWFAEDLRPFEEVTGETFAEIPSGLKAHFDDRTGPFAGEIDWVWFSPDGTILVARNRDDKLSSLWDVESGDLKLSLLAGTRVVGFMPENTIVLADDNQHSVILLQIDTGRQTTLFKNLGERDYISRATPDGRLLIAWDDPNVLRFYGVPTESKSTL